MRSGKRVAVKVMASASLARATRRLPARFRREVKVTSELAHPHVVQLSTVSATTPSGQPYLVMEYLEGEDLETAPGAVGGLSPPRRWRSSSGRWPRR